MSRIDDIESRANAATEDERTLRSTIADNMPIEITWRWAMEQDYNNGGGQARFFYDSPTPRDVESLIAFVREVEARHTPSKTKLLETSANLSTTPGAAPDTWTLSGLQTVEVSSCDACHMPWPCPDRRALDRLNGESDD